MAAASDEETIELSEALKTIFEEDENSPRRSRTGNTSLAKTPQHQIGHALNSSRSSGGRRKSPHGSTQSKQNCRTPLSRKSSLLQRSLGHSSGKSSPKKRKHAHEVIILRPPKKRASGSTPGVTSTSKLTPKAHSTPNTLLGTSISSKSQHFPTTPVSSVGKQRSRLNPAQRLSGGDGQTDRKMLFLEGNDNLSEKDREKLALQAQYLSLLEQRRMALESGSSSSLHDDLIDLGAQIGSGGLSLDVTDQSTKISLVARGNQDDSLTNITWLRRMSAPDLDPVTLKQLKNQNQDPHKERPPYSYSALIQFAISSAPEGKLTLRDIYFWIETNFPYFRTAKLGWKNSIRHNLSLHKIFVREAPTGHGQPAYWKLRPGTVVRLPERKIVVHNEMAAFQQQPGMQECFMPEGAVDMRMMGNPQMPMDPSMNPMLMNEPGSMPMLSAPDGMAMSRTPILSSTPVVRSGSKVSKRVPPILPKGTPPYALVPLPIYFTTDPKTGQLVPANGEKPPPSHHIKSSSSPGLREIAPKPQTNTPASRVPLSISLQRGATMDSGYGSTDSSMGDDVGRSLLRDSIAIKKENEEKGGYGKENALSAEFDLGLDVDDDLLKTPPKSLCPDWLSPIRGFTPGRDSGFSIRDTDFNFTPFKTGFTPNNKMGHSNTPRHLMLSPVSRNIPCAPSGGRSVRKAKMTTPRRHVPLDSNAIDGSLHNSSFDQIFGDVNFDVDPDHIDVGNMSWLLQSPPSVK